MVTGVANQRPAGSMRPAQEVCGIDRSDQSVLLLATANAFSKARCEIQALEVVRLDIGAQSKKLVVWAAGQDNGEPIVCMTGDQRPAITKIKLNSLGPDAAPMGEIPTRKGRLDVVSLSVGRSGYDRVRAVSAYDDTRGLGHCRTRFRVAADASDSVAIPKDEVFRDQVDVPVLEVDRRGLDHVPG